MGTLNYCDTGASIPQQYEYSEREEGCPHYGVRCASMTYWKGSTTNYRSQMFSWRHWQQPRAGFPEAWQVFATKLGNPRNTLTRRDAHQGSMSLPRLGGWPSSTSLPTLG